MIIFSDNLKLLKTLFPKSTSSLPNQHENNTLYKWRTFTTHKLIATAQTYSPLDINPENEALCFLEDFAESSQFDRLLNLQKVNAPICTIAKTGSGFHGQKQNIWETFPGNLHICYSLPLKKQPQEKPHLQTAIIILKILQNNTSQLNNDKTIFSLKAPNDILIQGKKCAGILASLRKEQSPSPNSHLLSLGIGINLKLAPSLEDYPTASLADFNLHYDQTQLIENISKELSRLFL